MALPKQIQDQVEHADQLVKDLAKSAAGDIPPVEPVIETSLQEPAPVVTPIPENVVPIKTDEDTWAHRYNVLQGKYNAEVPRLQAQLRDASAYSAQLQQALATLQQTTSAAAAPHVSSGQLVRPEEVTEYGEEFLDVVRRAALEAVNPQLSQLSDQIRPVMDGLASQVNTVSQRQALSAEQEFFVQLGQAVPNWETLNADERFHVWLSHADPLTGISRQVYLNDARRTMDLARVANIFKAFPGSAVESSRQDRRDNSADLAKLQQPGRSVASPVPAHQAGEKNISRGDITKLYDDYRKGLYKGRDAEFRQLEKEMLDAVNSGRLQ